MQYLRPCVHRSFFADTKHIKREMPVDCVRSRDAHRPHRRAGGAIHPSGQRPGADVPGDSSETESPGTPSVVQRGREARLQLPARGSVGTGWCWLGVTLYKCNSESIDSSKIFIFSEGTVS